MINTNCFNRGAIRRHIARNLNTPKSKYLLECPTKTVVNTLEHFKTLEKQAKKLGAQGAIFRDNYQVAQNTVEALKLLKRKGQDLSNIKVVVSRKAFTGILRKMHIDDFKQQTVQKIMEKGLEQQKLEELLKSDMWKTAISQEKKKFNSMMKQNANLSLDKITGIGGVTLNTRRGEMRPFINLNPDMYNFKSTPGSFSTNSKLSAPVHELIHALHFKNIYEQQKRQFSLNNPIEALNSIGAASIKNKANMNAGKIIHNVINSDIGPLGRVIISEKDNVSQYGATTLAEFVAEMGTKMALSTKKEMKKVNKTLIQLYKNLLGPEV